MAASSMQRGLFFVFEGLDRSGKSTQSERLFNHLKESGKAVKKLQFPNRGTTIGGLINSYLQSKSELSDEAIHLLFSSNRWETSVELEKDLAAGTSIVCDRYAFSGVAYTAAKGLKSLAWCKAPDVGLPEPDCVFYLDVDPQTAKSRADYGEERYEKAEFQKKVGAQFATFKDEKFWCRLDASREKDDLTNEIQTRVRSMYEGGLGAQPVKRLW
eukprot:CAMPEP_0178984910 /NCGR_PEP_ID=MMETSP0795-20121207/1873_1 /TAXON_ID=88552 /ORGANISM="Amoebophrya sp., Strain Ameob2" /LENGTH=213 /DNA_ID=CAMNT_0020675837 /DNA_START=167 /DNA_END=805 /DNA_ORIENTATION=+